MPIDGQAGRLEGVVDHDDLEVLARFQKLQTTTLVARHDHDALGQQRVGKEPGLVRGLRLVFRREDDGMLPPEPAAMPACEDAHAHVALGQGADERDHARRLARATGLQVADADDPLPPSASRRSRSESALEVARRAVYRGQCAQPERWIVALADALPVRAPILHVTQVDSTPMHHLLVARPASQG
jgi:hypothetical protein